jgi:hypothetical protein
VAALLISAAFAAALPYGSAHAQTATDLKCKGCVGKKDIGKKAVRTRNLKKNAVKAKSLADGAVTSEKITDSAVTAAKIADGAVTPDHLGDGAKPAGVASAVEPGPIELTGSLETAFSIDVEAPGPGSIFATADFYAETAAAIWGCNLVSGDEAGLNLIYGKGPGPVPTSLTRTIPVAAAGTVTLNLICTEAGGDVDISNVNLNVLFVPGSY